MGAFYQPEAVIVDLSALATLPAREFFSGWAEIVKAALIQEASFFEWLENNVQALRNRDIQALTVAVQRACEIKRDIIEGDELESKGLREFLNLGHTFAHGIEHVLGYGSWLHGEAVAVGLVLAARLSAFKGMLTSVDANRISVLLEQFSLPIQLPPDMNCDMLIEAMQMDKKVRDGRLRFVLLESSWKIFS
jgi:3-dehydroquinate synthase